MNREVIDAIQRGRREKIRSYVLMNISTMLNKGYDYKWICVVEGKTDRLFYSNISEIDLKTKTRYLWNYRTQDTYVDVDVGKDAVISSYRMIRKNPRFNVLLNKCIFIIDHDYDGAKSMKYDYDVDRENKMSITLGHSYENYFLEKENVKKIFDYLGKNEKEITKFEQKYKQFLAESSEFFRLKSATIEVLKKGSICYDMYADTYHTNVELSKDIFDFKFDNFNFDNNYFNKKIMYNEIERMRNYINQYQNKSALKFYNHYSKNIINNRSYLRGHEAMNFLTAYLRDVFNIELINNSSNELLEQLTRIIDVNMNFVNGLGESIN